MICPIINCTNQTHDGSKCISCVRARIQTVLYVGCMYVGCDKPHRARGLCTAHYQWAMRPLQRRTIPPCTVADCTRPQADNHLCATHRDEQARADFLEEVEFFRSWNWADERVAARLGMTLDAMQKRLGRMEMAA